MDKENLSPSQSILLLKSSFKQIEAELNSIESKLKKDEGSKSLSKSLKNLANSQQQLKSLSASYQQLQQRKNHIVSEFMAISPIIDDKLFQLSSACRITPLSPLTDIFQKEDQLQI